MAESKHGGSPSSGIVLPIGLDALKPAAPDGMVLVPQEVVDARKQAEERKERALQLERRRVALEVVPAIIGRYATDSLEFAATSALFVADQLIAQTGGGI